MEGPNGRYLCAVLPVLGPTVYEWRHTLGTDDIRVNDQCHQITKGPSFFHSKGICHGEFRPDNILMRLRSDALDRMGRDEVRQMLGPLEFADVLTTDGNHNPNAPEYVVTGIVAAAFRHLVVDQVAIIDFGESFETSKPPAVLGIPRRYAAPGVTFGGRQSQATSQVREVIYSLSAAPSMSCEYTLFLMTTYGGQRKTGGQRSRCYMSIRWRSTKRMATKRK